MRRRNAGDDQFRRVFRRVQEGDTSSIPALARLWERQGQTGRLIPSDTLRRVVEAFVRIERDSDQRDGPTDVLDLFRRSYPMTGHGDRDCDVGFVKGVMDALGLTAEQVWDESEVARRGAGAVRLKHRLENADLVRGLADARQRGFRIDVSMLPRTGVETPDGLLGIDARGTIHRFGPNGEILDYRDVGDEAWRAWADHFGVQWTDFVGPDSAECDEHCEEHEPECDRQCAHSREHMNGCLVETSRVGIQRERDLANHEPSAGHPHYSLLELVRMPTIGSSQDADLKLDDDGWRIWLTRGSRRVVVERLDPRQGRWVLHETYEAEGSSRSNPSRRAPVFYHGAPRKALASILKKGLEPSEGWGGAGTFGVYLAGTPEGALYWAKLAWQRAHDEKMEASRFDRKYGDRVGELLAIVEVKVPANAVKNLRADMEQAEDVGFEGDESDWEASLEEIGDVMYDGSVPAAWVREVSLPS